MDELDAADDDALERVAAGGAEACFACRLARERREPVVIQRVAREGTAEVRASAAEVGVEGVRALDMLLFEVVVVVGRRDVEAVVRVDAAALDRVLVGV